MKKKIMMLSVIALFAFNVKAQTAEKKNPDEYTGAVVTHSVQPGETMLLIAKKYLVKPQDIYELNPKATDGIYYNMQLQIPVDKKTVKDKPLKGLKKDIKETESVTAKP